MNAFQAVLVSAIIFIVSGLWSILNAYNQFGVSMDSFVFVLPCFGLVLLILTPWIAKAKNRSIWIATILSLVLMIFLYFQFKKSEGAKSLMIILEIICSVWSLVLLIKSIIFNKINQSKSTEIGQIL